jgi:hypothetical protein
MPIPPLCKGTCKWVNQGGEWFATDKTCSAGCNCAGSFRSAPNGPIKQVVVGSTKKGDGLPDPDFQKFRTKFPELITQGTGGAILVGCAPEGRVFDLF